MAKASTSGSKTKKTKKSTKAVKSEDEAVAVIDEEKENGDAAEISDENNDMNNGHEESH